MARVQVQCLTFSPSDLAVNRSFQKSYKPAKRKLEKKKTMKAVCTSTCIDYFALTWFSIQLYQSLVPNIFAHKHNLLYHEFSICLQKHVELCLPKPFFLTM